MRKIKPISNWIVVEPDAVDEEVKTASGIITPFESPDENKGTVLAVGPGALNSKTGERRPCYVKVGDRVLYGSFAGEKVEHEGKQCRLMQDHEVMGVFGEEASS